jgi:hypothetical protein
VEEEVDLIEPRSIPSVSTHITSAFFIARTKYPDLHSGWIDLSGRLSGRFSLPVAEINLQQQGDIDLLIRCMEDEFVPERARVSSNILGFSSHYQMMLSEAWIIGCYEILRAFRQRDRELKRQGHPASNISDTQTFRALILDFELLRMPIAKFEIADDRHIGGGVLKMVRYPPNGNATDQYNYIYADPARSHLMPKGISQAGSATWYAVDNTGTERWLERRNLSDRLLSLREEIEPAGLREARLRAERGE